MVNLKLVYNALAKSVCYVWLLLVLCIQFYTQRVRKNGPTLLLRLTLPDANRLSKFLHRQTEQSPARCTAVLRGSLFGM